MMHKRWRRLALFITFIIILFIIAQIRPTCLWPYVFLNRFPRLTSVDNRDVTLVTAYFNLSHLGKTFSAHKYAQWASVLQYVQNPLIVYTDSKEVQRMVLHMRRHLLNRTQAIEIQQAELQSFQDVNKIRDIFNDPIYPKFSPNTVIPEYPCSQHSKYELVQRTISAHKFSYTKYIAWIDIGYFRYLTDRRRRFWIVTPPGMDDAKVAVTEVFSADSGRCAEDIFKSNLVWVGGGMSLATRPVYFRFAEEYQRATKAFLRQGLSNTDQQVIYAMFKGAEARHQHVQTQLQTYSWNLSDLQACWFYLGYLCYREIE